jgi:hypothetical protein
MSKMSKAEQRQREMIMLVVTLKSGDELQVMGTFSEFELFNSRFQKYARGMVASTDDYRVLVFGDQVFMADAIASYYGFNQAHDRRERIDLKYTTTNTKSRLL